MYANYNKSLSCYILPENEKTLSMVNYNIGEVAVIICLYYEDTVSKYLAYLENIPKEITIYIVSSNLELCRQVNQYIAGKKNIIVITKKNRGRDVSALLVACREIILQYKYICFIHDKKAKSEWLREDTEKWIENLWDNTLHSTEYIQQILYILHKQSDLGLLVPPEPIGEYMLGTIVDAWGENLDNTKQLAEELELNCIPNADDSPIALGTVFWGKTNALNKLIMKEWKYEDFPDEPMPVDGTISHAIERILPYVAKDAGYQTKQIMTISCALERMCFFENNLSMALRILDKHMGLLNATEIAGFDEQLKRLGKYCEEHEKVYLYGAGKKGIGCLKVLRFGGYEPEAFLVTEKENKENACICGIPVREISEITDFNNVGIIISVGRLFVKEIELVLNRKGIDDYIKYHE